MADKSPIEWTDATWSPLRVRVRDDAAAIAEAKGYTSLVSIASKMAGHVGPHCEKVSDGCKCCYSETNNGRCLPSNGTGLPFDRRSRDLVEPFVDEKALLLPLKWKAPRRIFVENQSDLFGEWYTDEMIDRVFAVMALCPQHTFQVLTKRAKRLVNYMCTADCSLRNESIAAEARKYSDAQRPPGGRFVLPSERIFEARRVASGEPWKIHAWPLPNVWLGVSVENQEQADKRIPELVQTPAAVRFISAEPLLGPIDLEHVQWNGTHQNYVDVLRGGIPHPLLGIVKQPEPPIDWVIDGGETGPGAPPSPSGLVAQPARSMRGGGRGVFP